MTTVFISTVLARQRRSGDLIESAELIEVGNARVNVNPLAAGVGYESVSAHDPKCSLSRVERSRKIFRDFAPLTALGR